MALILLIFGVARGVGSILAMRQAAAHGSTAQAVRPAPAQAPEHLGVAGTDSTACVAYSPRGPSNRRTVFIDPGHGGPDPGAGGRTSTGVPVAEKAATLAVALQLRDRLLADGYRVVLSRTKDSLVTQLRAGDLNGTILTSAAVLRDLQTRIACANAARADVLLSVHFNGFSDPSVGGTETIYDPVRTFAADNRRLAESLQAALVSALNAANRGVLRDDQLDAPTLTDTGATYGHLIELGPPLPGFVDTPSSMPGAVVEPLFVTHPDEAATAVSSPGRSRIVAALRTGLERYLASAPAR